LQNPPFRIAETIAIPNIGIRARHFIRNSRSKAVPWATATAG
jgi:hypothetical protein